MQYIQNLTTLILIFLAIGFFFSCGAKKDENFHPTVEIRYNEGKAQMFRHGEPYFIKGVAGTQHLEKAAAYGANSIRTWSLHDAESILDEAHKLGLTVTLGLEIGRQFWGSDFSYWKFWEVNKKIEELRPLIEKYKVHPALLMWGVGNEVQNFGGGKRFLILYTINKVAKMIKEVDPDHPTMTAVNVPSQVKRLIPFRFLMPHIDVIGFNAFAEYDRVHERVYGKRGWHKAYMLSEWGAEGHWEVIDTEWGAPKEPSMEEKVIHMGKIWNTINQDRILNIGTYAFYWGFKYEITPSWFSMFSEEGHESAQIKFLKKVWTGEDASNQPPIIRQIFIENQKENQNVFLDANSIYSAQVIADDPELDALSYRWEIRGEEYSLYESGIVSHNMEYYFLNMDEAKVKFTAPKNEGDYRLYVFVFDGKGNFTTHNIPFYVLKK